MGKKKTRDSTANPKKSAKDDSNQGADDKTYILWVGGLIACLFIGGDFFSVATDAGNLGRATWQVLINVICATGPLAAAFAAITYIGYSHQCLSFRNENKSYTVLWYAAIIIAALYLAAFLGWGVASKNLPALPKNFNLLTMAGYAVQCLFVFFQIYGWRYFFAGISVGISLGCYLIATQDIKTSQKICPQCKTEWPSHKTDCTWCNRPLETKKAKT